MFAGFERPSAIQQTAISHPTEGHQTYGERQRCNCPVSLRLVYTEKCVVVCVRDLQVVFCVGFIAYFSNFLSLQVEGYVYVGCCLHVNILLCIYVYYLCFQTD